MSNQDNIKIGHWVISTKNMAGIHKLIVNDGSLPSTPYIYNVELIEGEASKELPANCKMFEFQCEDDDVQVYFTFGGEDYMILKGGAYYSSPRINTGTEQLIVYFYAETDTVVNLIAWV